MNHSEIVSFIWGVADLHPRHVQAGQVPGHHSAAHGSPAPRLRPRARPSGASSKLRPSSGARSSRTSTPQLRQGRPASPSTTPRATTSRCSWPTRPTWRPTCATTSPASARTCARSSRSSTSTTRSASSTRRASSSRSWSASRTSTSTRTRSTTPPWARSSRSCIRKFNEALNENPGEHFTPRDVVHLMVDLMLAGDEERIRRKGIVVTVYDPCCGSGGMLLITKEHITVGLRKNGDVLRPPDQPGGGDPPVRPGGQPRDLGRLEVRPLHEGPDRPRRRQHRLRQHAFERPPCRPPLRLPDRQSPLRQGLEARRGRRHGRARARRRPAASARACHGSATASSSSSCTCWRT